jgi:hypothetical protein
MRAIRCLSSAVRPRELRSTPSPLAAVDDCGCVTRLFHPSLPPQPRQQRHEGRRDTQPRRGTHRATVPHRNAETRRFSSSVKSLSFLSTFADDGPRSRCHPDLQAARDIFDSYPSPNPQCDGAPRLRHAALLALRQVPADDDRGRRHARSPVGGRHGVAGGGRRSGRGASVAARPASLAAAAAAATPRREHALLGALWIDWQRRRGHRACLEGCAGRSELRRHFDDVTARLFYRPGGATMRLHLPTAGNSSTFNVLTSCYGCMLFRPSDRVGNGDESPTGRRDRDRDIKDHEHLQDAQRAAIRRDRE